MNRIYKLIRRDISQTIHIFYKGVGLRHNLYFFSIVPLILLTIFFPRIGLVLLFSSWLITTPFRHMLRLQWLLAFKFSSWDYAPRMIPGSIRHHPFGRSATIIMRRNQSFKELSSRVDKVATDLNVREITVKRDDNHAGRIKLTVVERLPWEANSPSIWPNTEMEATSVWDEMPLAENQYLETISTKLIDEKGGKDILGIGVPGSGKSNLDHLIISQCALDVTCENIILLDGKLAELHAWRDIATYYVGFNVDEAIDALKFVDKWVDGRLEELAQQGRRTVRPGDETLLLGVDEWSTYVNTVDKTASKEFNTYMRRIIERKRAVGGISFVSAQKPASDTTPTFVRDLIGHRGAFYCTTPEMSDIGLGKGNASRGYDASTLPKDFPGLAYLDAAATTPELVRVFHVGDDDEIAAMAKRARKLREDYQASKNPPSGGSANEPVNLDSVSKTPAPKPTPSLGGAGYPIPPEPVKSPL